MFSFFRKEKPEDLLKFLKEGQPEFESAPAYNRNATPGEGDGIEVTEALGGLSPELEEAAVMYANGKIGEAATQLNRYLLDNPDVRDPQPWYMLFDLYEASDQAAPFEDAAVDFAVKFERSPPTWTPRGKPRKVLTPAPTMSYGERYGSAERVRQQRFFQEAQHAPFVRLDLSRTQTPDEMTAQAILTDVIRLNDMQMPIELIGGPGFAVRLNAARQGDRLTDSGWFLLMAVLQILGKEEDFENVAVDYAVAHEVSPPSYVAPLPIPERSNGHHLPQSGTVFQLQGVVGPGNETQLDDLKQFAKDKTQVEIDLSTVSRIDFAVVGLLLETLIELDGVKCKVLFKEGNELVNILLQIVGAGQFAAILGRTRI